MWARLKVPTRDVEAFRIYIQGSFNSGDKRRELLPELRRAITEAEGEVSA